MEIAFLIINILGLVISLLYFKRGVRGSALVTVLMSALILIRKVIWLRWIGVAFVAFSTICFILFRTAFGTFILKCFGRNSDGTKKS